jgi:hypothetical protein
VALGIDDLRRDPAPLALGGAEENG